MDERDDDRFEDVGLVRLTSWATAAAVALTVAALASLSPPGSQRVSVALADWKGQSRQAALPRDPETENERRSVNEALRLLASDRDRLMNRLGSLERDLEDITGSIKSQVAAPAPPAPQLPPQEIVAAAAPAAAAEPPPKPELPWLMNAPEPWPSPSIGTGFAPGPPAAPGFPPQRVAALPAEALAAGSTLGRTEFGVDLGSGSDIDDVRLLWSAMRSQHGRLLGNLRPVIQRRDDPNGNPDYRLIAGPLANAGAAARLCAALGSADVVCTTKAYQGERLVP